MDNRKDTPEMLSELCSVVSGSSENSRYDDICTSLPVMKGITSRHVPSDLSPLVPLQDIIVKENIWIGNLKHQDDEHLFIKSSSSHKSLKHTVGLFPNSNQTCNNVIKSSLPHQCPSPFIQEQSFHDNGDSSVSLRSRKEQGIGMETNKSDAYENISSITSTQSQTATDPMNQTEFLIMSVEQRCSDNAIILEDSQVDLFESDTVSGQKIQNLGHEESSPKITENSLRTPDAVLTTSCTIPPNTTEHQLSVSTQGQSFLPSEINSCNVQLETIFLIDNKDAYSDTSNCTISPDRLINENQCSASKLLAASSEIRFENVPTVHKSDSSTQNQDLTLQSSFSSKDKDCLMYQEHKEMREQDTNIITNVSYSSQGTKASSDLFLSSLEASIMQTMPQNLQQTIENTALYGLSSVQLEKGLEREGRNECLQNSKSLRNKSESKEDDFERCIGEKNPCSQNMPRKLTYDESIKKEHQRKMCSIQRFESLCNQVVSRLDSSCCPKNSVEMESYMHRCEYLITKMHAMQKEEKTRLCSTLEKTDISKQKKKTLKIQLKHLKARHQSLMDIARKYEITKSRVFTKDEESSQQSVFLSHNSTKPQQLPNPEKSDNIVEKFNSKTYLFEQSQLCTIDKNNEKECSENALSISEPTSFICVSGSSDTGGTIDPSMHEKENRIMLSNNSNSDHIQSGSVNDETQIKSYKPMTILLDDTMSNVTLQDDTLFKETKRTIKSSDNKNISNVSNAQNLKTIVDRKCDIPSKLPTDQRKSASRFNPPMKKKTESMKCLYISLNSDVLMQSDEQVIPSSLTETIHGLIAKSCESIGTPWGKETSVYVDNFLFTEFQDPSLRMDEITVQKSDNEGQLRVTNFNSEIENAPSGSRDGVCVRRDMSTEFQDKSIINEGAHAKLDHSNVQSCVKEAQTSSDLNLPQMYKNDNNNTESDGVLSKQGSDIVNIISHVRDINDITCYTIPTTQDNHNNDMAPVDTTHDLCVSSLYLPAQENISKEAMIVADGQQSMTQAVADIGLQSNGPNLSNPPEKETPPTLCISNDTCSIKDPISKTTCCYANEITTFAYKSNSHDKNQSKAIPSTSRMLEGPPSPCSTQGSSLFPVSSKEIVRRVQTRQLPHIGLVSEVRERKCHEFKTSTKNPITATVSKESASVSNINISTLALPLNQYPKTNLQFSIDGLTFPAKDVEGYNPQQTTGLTSTQSGSLFQASSKGTTKQILKPILSGPTLLNLEPSAISLNTIMTSSLCVPERQNSSNEISKPKRPRKRKSKIDSQFTLSSSEIPIVDTCLTERKKKNSCIEIQGKHKKVAFSDNIATDHVVFNEKVHCEQLLNSRQEELTDHGFPSIAKFKSLVLQHNNEMASEECFNLHTIINGLRTVQLISDQELIPLDKGSISSNFWDEDFAQITMSKPVWDSVVEW